MNRADQYGATAAASSAIRMAGLQLLQAQSMLAPWVDRQDALPSPLCHGPIELLQRAAHLSESPLASAKLVDDTVILLTYGVSYLQDHYDQSERSSRRLTEFASQMESYRGLWRRKAQRIQTTWRTQRFHTNRLPVLELMTSDYLQQDVQELIQKKKHKASLGEKQDSVTDLVSVPVEINEKELQEQVVKYAAELQRRVDARLRDADELVRQQLKDQRAQDDKRKRLALQKKKRYERACRQWHYFATKILQNAKQTQESNDSARRQQQSEAAATSAQVQGPAQATGSDRTHAMLKVLKNPAQRQAIRRFVAKTIARGVSRVLCAYNMGTIPDDQDDAVNGVAGADAETTTSTAKVLRLGLLLCDLHFGAKYTGLYQRFFERVAKERGMRVEWHVFNCLKAQFPTKAHHRVVNGFLVAGGPNVGVIDDADNPEDDAEARQRRRSSAGGVRKNRHFGRWRDRLVVLLRDLYRGKQTILGGLGLGHVILAEALGGKIGMKEWEDGWNLLDPTIFAEETTAIGERRLGQSMQGVRFLHGEFVQSMGAAEKSSVGSSKLRLKAWRCPGDHSFVSCFRDTLTLSVDGSPECGSFVFETLGEFYEREKQQRRRRSSDLNTGTRRMPSKDRLRIDEDDEDEDEEDDFKPIVLDTSLSLEEKRKRLGVSDASVSVARLFFDHFHRQILNVSRQVRDVQHATMAIAGVVCSSEEFNVTRSINQLGHHESISAIFLNVTASADGHLVVTNPQALALVMDQDRRNREQATKQQRVAVLPTSNSTGPSRNSVHRSAGLTLQMLRQHDQQQSSSQTSLATTSPRQGNSRTIRLPSIRSDASTKSLSEIVPSGHESNAHRLSMMRRPSALSSQRHIQASNDPADKVNVLTLSQALSFLTKRDANVTPKRVFIRWIDEECKQTHDIMPLTKSDLRTLWLRLIAAIRIADLPNDQVAIVSRHSMLLDFLKRKRPTWTFVKDCRRSEMTHRKRLKKVTQYAAVADIILLDQEFLLSNSANENDALLKRAHTLGLHLYVAPRDESPKAPMARPLVDKPTSVRRVSSSLQKRSSRRSVSGLSKEISTKTNQTGSGNADYDMHVVEFMLLAFSGLDGVITSYPEAAVDALEKIAAKNEAMQQVEQIFRDWQTKDNSKVTSSPKRLASIAPSVDDAADSDDPADYVAGDNNYDSDDSVPENEIVAEISRQWAEHSPSDQAKTSFTAKTTSGNGGGVAGGAGNNNGPLAGLVSSPFVPLRPLQPRPNDQVFGVARFRRENSSRGAIAPSFTGEGRSQLRPIGSFRAAMKRTGTAGGTFRQQTAPQTMKPAPPRSETMDSGREDTRSPEAAVLKPMSTRKILFSSR